ncbi:MAG TPA: hypothetical protein VFH88_02710 [Candidatus Krumholzibacteria bacterium]|nr:hypothetical protein [Candidatus Krumholzibacteria bacterium]
MKRMLPVFLAVMVISGTAMADYINVYTDASGNSCVLASGFTSTATVIEKFSLGTTGSHFKIEFPAGTIFYGFNTSFVPTGVLTSDLSLAYGQCLVGDIPLGAIVADLAPGLIYVLPPDTFSVITSTDCNFVDHTAYGWHAYVDMEGPCAEPLAATPSTWGSVKALYR